jgi:hypothetical protein
MENFADDADRWNEFKKLLSPEDKASMKRILNKARINADAQVDLKATFTKEEKTWTTNFAWRAFLWGFAEKPLIK